jgi:hypothetical protein
MSDLDTLRRALRTQHGWDGEQIPDLGEIMTRGRRLRLWRRLAAVGGALCVVAVIFGAVVGIGRLTRPAPVPAQRPAGSAHPAHHSSSPGSTRKPVPKRSGQASPYPAVAPSQAAGPTPTPTPSSFAQSSPTPSSPASPTPTSPSFTSPALSSSAPPPSRR